MEPTGNQPGRKSVSASLSVAIGAVVGQVGCLTLLIVLAALFGGLWMDKLFGTKPLITIGLMIASIPITLFLMFWVVRRATTRIQATMQAKPGQQPGGDQQ